MKTASQCRSLQISAHRYKLLRADMSAKHLLKLAFQFPAFICKPGLQTGSILPYFIFGVSSHTLPQRSSVRRVSTEVGGARKVCDVIPIYKYKLTVQSKVYEQSTICSYKLFCCKRHTEDTYIKSLTRYVMSRVMCVVDLYTVAKRAWPTDCGVDSETYQTVSAKAARAEAQNCKNYFTGYA